MGKLRWGWVWTVLLLWTAAPAEAAALKVFVSIAPQKYFVQKIGGDLVSVSVLVPPGASPHQFEPKPRQMAELAKSAVYFAIGVEFEKVWLKKIAAANPKLRVVHTDDGIAKIASVEQDHHGEPPATGLPRDGRRSQAKDSHCVRHAGSPRLALSAPGEAPGRTDPRWPERRRSAPPVERMNPSAPAFLREIDALDAELKAVFAGRKGEQFMVFHPSWGYFAAAYGLEQVPVEIEGKEPKPAQLQNAHPPRPGAPHRRDLRPAAVLRQERRVAGPGDRRAGCRCRSAGGRLGCESARASAGNSERPRDERTIMTEPIIQMRDVWFSFNGQPVLREVNLTVPRGDFLVVIGPNGGGKTTLLKLMLGLLHPHAGNGRRFRRAAAPGVAPHRLRAAECPYQQGLSRFPFSMSS